MSTTEQGLQRAFKIVSEAQNDLIKSTPQLDFAISNSKAHGLPSIAIAPAQGVSLSILCQLVQAKNVLEIGTLGGYSTLFFANSVPGVKVTSIEYNPKHHQVASENTKDAKNVEIILGAALDVLPKLAAEGRKFDFVFIDADWDEQREYFDWAVKLTNKGKAIYVDNVVRQLTEAEADGSDKGRALIDHVRQDDRVEATLIPTLSTHKVKTSELVDGYLLAVVK
ncbi:hypothetical protein M409DRAFT_61125 [Zasmidium cellare ATCC 36951]|uniref:O-methyltransferase domain-containing protein n=1 Tax=Zasmidium cellare ATCC 36951 TaxID=1080233 RepID=A0A6A6BZR1_ZASCE|nr:uncharacterized protein M409DRAFT_61125 [Zasmidium cellare ATCC 36951]KAF2159049.1 hypothetical protein M409DRAFT_61125 [Zasmidium cellare ATCC 36951]